LVEDFPLHIGNGILQRWWVTTTWEYDAAAKVSFILPSI